MMLKIDRLKIIANTAQGKYGVDIPFQSGLFILRVENTHGKSTCLNGIAYALGMERALGMVDIKLPFPASLTKEILTEDGAQLPVLSSEVQLQISNDRDGVATIRRKILGATDDNVSEVFLGTIDDISKLQSRTLFMHREGDTTRESGFYHWLSEFVGWKLPQVPKLDGSECPLYPSTFFPTWFVEQKKGWSSIQATTPQIFKIKEAKKRALEFLLKMDTNSIVKKKFKIKSEIEKNQNSWAVEKSALELRAAKIPGEVRGVPETPHKKFDKYSVDIAVNENDRWESIQSLRADTYNELCDFLNSMESGKPDAAEEGEIQREIETLRNDVRKLSDRANNIEEELHYNSHQIQASQTRIKDLEEDQRKYEDLKKIGNISKKNDFPAPESKCPTCNQEISGDLINMEASATIMSVEDSLAYIKEQKKAFISVKESLKLKQNLSRLELTKTNSRIAEKIEEISRLRRNSFSPESALLEENLRRKISLENLIEKYDHGILDLQSARLKFDSLSSNYNALIEKRKRIPQSILSDLDIEKLRALRQQLIDHLISFGFSSFDASLIDISEETYLPTREGFDLGFDTSASDGIRVIWGYLISLFAVSFLYETNHPKVLLFDEPKQQDANPISFTELLNSARTACILGGQIILATSESEESILNSIGKDGYTLYSFPKSYGKILKRL